MQVTVTMKFEIDPEEWLEITGQMDESDAAIRSDVKLTCAHAAQEQLFNSGFNKAKLKSWN